MPFQVDDRVRSKIGARASGVVKDIIPASYDIEWDHGNYRGVMSEAYLEPAPKVAKWKIGDEVKLDGQPNTVSGVYLDRFGNWSYWLRSDNIEKFVEEGEIDAFSGW